MIDVVELLVFNGNVVEENAIVAAISLLSKQREQGKYYIARSARARGGNVNYHHHVTKCNMFSAYDPFILWSIKD